MWLKFDDYEVMYGTLAIYFSPEELYPCPPSR
jgi:hypothetical protein